MNQITLIGNIATDLTMTHTTNSQFCKLRVAVPRRNDKTKSDFFDLIVWGKRADALMTYAGKGDKMCFVGELHAERYENEQGEKKTKYEIVVSDFEFIKTSKSRSNAPVAEEKAPAVEPEPLPDMENMSIDELPFET